MSGDPHSRAAATGLEQLAHHSAATAAHMNHAAAAAAAMHNPYAAAAAAAANNHVTSGSVANHVMGGNQVPDALKRDKDAIYG